MESHDERIGQLVQRYTSSLALIAGLRDSVNSIAGKLSRLSSCLTENTRWVNVSENSITFNHNQNISVDVLEDLHAKLSALKAAQEDQARMESCLRDAGLGDLIGSGPRR